MAKGKGKEVQTSRGNGVGEDQQNAVVTRSRGHPSRFYMEDYADHQLVGGSLQTSSYLGRT